MTKVVYAPMSDNYITCFPKRNDILLKSDVETAVSSAYLSQRLSMLCSMHFVEMDERGYQMTPLGLRWYQNLQEDLLSVDQRALHLETLAERKAKLDAFDGYYARLGRVEGG